MVHIQWKERYNINYKEVDAQHRRLLDILNHLLDLIQCKRPSDEIGVIFHRLCTYALDHFTLEERYLEASGYPGLVRQKEEHAYFVGKVLEFNDRYDPNDPAFLMETFEFLKTWYLRHILRTDTEYVPWVRRYQREARLKCILVDFDGLLATTDHEAFVADLAASSGTPATLLERRLFEEGLWSDCQSGALDPPALLAELSLLELTDAMLSAAFSKMYAPREDVLQLLEGLKTSYKLALVANSHPWHAEHVVRASPAFGLFDAVSLSHEAKALVPDHRILNDVLDQLGLMSEECLFLTSRADHAEAAEHWCFNGHVFQGPEGVLQVLAKRGA